MRSFLKTCLLLVSIIISGLSLAAQLKKPKYNDSLFSTYYHQRVSQFRSLPSVQGQIVFLGNSLTDGAEWSEMFDDGRILNRGISGDVSAGLINRADEVVLRKPKKIFLLIGTNDLARGMTPDSLVKNLLWLADYIKQESPSTQLFVQSIMPVNKVFKKFPQHMASVANIQLVNGLLSQSATKHDYLFLNLDSVFCNTNGELNTAYTNDGLHLNGLGYNAWKHHLFPYVYDLQSKASMIPLPQKIQWKKSFFPVYQCRSVLVNDTAILKEANVLLTKLKTRGLEMSIVDKVTAGKFIELKLGRVESPQNNDEAYHLQADDEKVVLTANTAQGIFNGIQTLLQLSRDNAFIDNCEITDWPAFS
ncbi:MAG: beta-N-acetylhexosaminidase, partial [Chitinophagaceae bacterium]